MIKDIKILSKINKYVLEEFPKEAVIGVKGNELYFFKNIHYNPEKHFKVDPIVYMRVKPDILIHSHTFKIGEKCVGPDRIAYDPRTPSYADMKCQEALQIPFGIVSTSGEDVSEPVFFPDYDAPIEGHGYISGVHDCLSVIQRFYKKEYGIIIPDFPREHGFWYEGKEYSKHRPHSINLYEENYKQVGFYEVSKDDMQRGDLLLMALWGNVSTHGAIYLGNGKIVHHITGRLSGQDIVSRWIKKVTKVLRHKENFNEKD